MEGWRPESFGEHMADGYDDWYGTRRADETTEHAVARLAELAGGGRVLELAVGTGRVALPLAARGLEVHGIDASPAMVERLREKPGGAALPVAIGDFADVGVEGTFDLVFLVFNTLFNLTTEGEQIRCFRNVAGRLSGGGAFVIEAYVPDLSGFVHDRSVKTVHVAEDRTVVELAVHDPASQLVRYEYVIFGDGETRIHPVPMRHAWPEQLDGMAGDAGLVLETRWSDWQRTPFTAGSPAHVSVYRKPAGG